MKKIEIVRPEKCKGKVTEETMNLLERQLIEVLNDRFLPGVTSTVTVYLSSLDMPGKKFSSSAFASNVMVDADWVDLPRDVVVKVLERFHQYGWQTAIKTEAKAIVFAPAGTKLKMMKSISSK